MENPAQVIHWLTISKLAKQVLSELGTNQSPLCHATLDRHEPNASIRHLRQVLVTAGVLDGRDEHLAALDRSVDTILAKVSDPGDRRLVRAFATWDRIGPLRGRLNGKAATYNQISAVRQEINQGARLLNWLRDQGTSLGNSDQGHIDQWLDQGNATCLAARYFVRWALAQHHAQGLAVPPPRGVNPVPALDTEQRSQLAARLLEDESIRLEDRVVGLICLLFAQRVSTIAALRTDQIIRDQSAVQLMLGEEPVHLPGALGILVERLASECNQRHRSLFGRDTAVPWLVPGLHPHRHVSSHTLTMRLSALGITTIATRHAAMRDLGAALPTSVIARLLRVSVTSIDRWKTGGTYADYAAIARRTTVENRPIG